MIDPICPRCKRKCCPAAKDWGNYCEMDEFHDEYLAATPTLDNAIEEEKEWIRQWDEVIDASYGSDTY